MFCNQGFNRFHGALALLPRFDQGEICFMQGADGIGRKVAPLQAFLVDAVSRGMVTGHDHIRWYVPVDGGGKTGKAVRADEHELVHGRKSAKYGVIAYAHMTGDAGRIRKDNMVTQHAIVSDMRISHE